MGQVRVAAMLVSAAHRSGRIYPLSLIHHRSLALHPSTPLPFHSFLRRQVTNPSIVVQQRRYTAMKLVWCPDTASKAYIDGVRAIAGTDAAPELAELVAAMAGGWNAQLIVDAPDASPSSSPSSSSRRPPATSLALAAAARRTGGRYARVDVEPDSGSSSSEVEGRAEDAMTRLEGVDLLVLDARRRDAAAVLRAARPGPRGMVVVRHGGDSSGGVRRRAAAPPWGMAAGTRVVRAAYLPIGAGGVEVLHVGVGKGPSLPTHQQSRRPGGGRGRWIRHVNHLTGEEHVFRRQ